LAQVRPSMPGLAAEASAKAGLSPIRTYSGGAGGCPAGTHYMGYVPNGMSLLVPISRSSQGPFAARVSRTSGRPRNCSSASAAAPRLGGRCGECEMNGHCGGCRARAYGMTGDLMAEDPLCTHQHPARFTGSPLLLARRSLGEGGATRDSVSFRSPGYPRDRVRPRSAGRRSHGTTRLPSA
jgi:hypothetical protein